MKLWRVALYLLIAAVLIYGLGKWQGRAGVEDAGIIARAEQALESGKAYRIQLAKLKAVSRTRVTAARAGTVRLLAIAPTMTPIALRESIETVTQDWETAFRAESTRADLAEHRVADLERNLASVLTVAECRLLGIGWMPRCPSRSVMFLLGAGSATVVVLAIK